LVLGLGLLYIVALTLRATPLGFATESSLNTPGEASIAAARATMTMGGEAPTQSEWDKEDDTHRIGYLLFTTHVDPFQTSYVAPFEITSLLILVATIGVIVLCKENEPRRPGPREEINREAPPIEPGKKTTLTR
jgi:NADH:ubiquinone oxidoreductase subunit 6 (subunit J)